MQNIDFSILNFIYDNFHCRAMDTVMPWITHLGDKGLLWILLALILTAIPKTRRAGLAMIMALIIEALVCNIIIKPLVCRVRPFDVNRTVDLLISPPTDPSFPSGHAGASFAAASGLYFSGDRLWIPSLVLAVLIAFSRLYLYVHYPSDVVAGALLGIASGWAGHAIAGRIRPEGRIK